MTASRSSAWETSASVRPENAPLPTSTNLNRCTVLSKRLETITPGDIAFFKKEFQSTQVKRFLEEFSRKITAIKIEDVPSLLAILEVCHLLWHMYGVDFSGCLSPMLIARYKRDTLNFPLYVFIVLLFATAFDEANETAFWGLVKDGIFLFSNFKNPKALERQTDICLSEMIFFLRVVGSAVTSFPISSPSLQASLEDLECDTPEIAKRLTSVVSDKTKEAFVKVFTRYFNEVVKPTFKQANSTRWSTT